MMFKNNVNNKPVYIMIKSWENYNNHNINVLKECLIMWSEKNCKYKSPFKFKTIFIDNVKSNSELWNPPYSAKYHNKRLFFITTSEAQLREHHLEILLNNKDVAADTFMSNEIKYSLFNTYSN